jgi:hypothetical protein
VTYRCSVSHRLENYSMKLQIYAKVFLTSVLFSCDVGSSYLPKLEQVYILSVLWMVHEWIWIIARIMIDREKYTTRMKTCSCHLYTTNPTCRLFSWEGTWTSIVRGRRIIAWEALGIIRFLWSSPHPVKDRLPFAGRNMTLKLKVYFKIRLLLWFILAASLHIPEGETTKVSLNWTGVFYFVDNTKKNKIKTNYH